MQNGQDPLRLACYIELYPKFSIRSCPMLVKAFELGASSLIDMWDGEWRTVNIDTVLVLKRQRLLLRHQPSIRELLTDCPGIEEELQMQPKRPSGNKRAGETLVSPYKKKTHVTSTQVSTTNSEGVVEILNLPQSPPASISTASSSRPSSSSTLQHPVPFPLDIPSNLTSTKNQLPTLSHNKWPGDFSVREISEGFDQIKTMVKDDPKMTEKVAHPVVFHGRSYTKATVCAVKKILRDAPETLKDEFTDLGDVPHAAWPYFTKALKDHRDVKCKGHAISESADTSDLNDGDRSSPSGSHLERRLAPSFDILLDSDSDGDDGDKCPFCNEPFDFVPSQKLLTMLMDINNKSYPDPLPSNPAHRSGASIRITLPFCERHNFESKDLPLAKAKQWPDPVDFNLLHKRILRLHGFLSRLLTADAVSNNEFVLAVKKDLGKNPTRSSGVANQYSGFDGDVRSIGAG